MATRTAVDVTPAAGYRELMLTIRIGRKTMINVKVLTWSLGLFGAVSYVVCVLYGLVVPETLHMTGWLESILPGFTWLTLTGFVIGLVESFLYGVYAGLVFAPIYNMVSRRLAQ